MAQFDEKSLKQHIRGADFLPVYVFCGNEDYLKKNFLDLIVTKVVNPVFESMNFSRYSGKDLDLQDVFEEALTLPMMSDKKCIVIDDYKLEGISDKDKAALNSYLESGCDTCIIIFYQSSADFSLTKTKKLTEGVEKFIGVCKLDKRSGSDLIKPLISSASKLGCTLSNQMANYLVSLVGDDFNTLINEINKVCSYAKEGEITKEDIDAVAVRSDDAEVYYLTRALVQKDFDKAYKVLHLLLKKKVDTSYIMGTLISSYVDMYRGKISVYCGERADVLSEDYQYRKTAFRLTNGARDASRIEVSTLRKCLDVLNETDMILKSGAEDEILALEKLMVKLFLVVNGEKV